MAHRICNSLISGVQNLHIVISTVSSSAWLSLSVHHWFRNRFYPQYSNEIHRTSSVRKSLETREKTAQTGKPVSLVLSICFVICIIVIVMLVVVPELGQHS